MIQAVKYRAYPNTSQQRELAQLFGNQRFVWNHFLSIQKQRLEVGELMLSGYEMYRMIPKLRDDFPWLKLSTVACLRAAVDVLYFAINQWRSHRSRFPRYKKRKDGQSVKTAQPGIPRNVAKLSQSMAVPIVKHREFVGKVISLTINKVPSGKYYASFNYDAAESTSGISVLMPRSVLGIDDGMKTLLTLSNGRKIKHTKRFKENSRRLRRQQRALARKTTGSSRYEAQKIRVAKIYEKIANARSFDTHLITTNLVDKARRENQAIAYQRTAIVNQMKNRRWTMALSETCIGEIRRQIAYKCLRANVPLFVVDQWQPTSKTCSCCGFKLKLLSLRTRTWVCPGCQAVHDRDRNAAINIARWGAPGLLVEGIYRCPDGRPDGQVVPMKREEAQASQEKLGGEADFGRLSYQKQSGPITTKEDRF